MRKLSLGQYIFVLKKPEHKKNLFVTLNTRVLKIVFVKEKIGYIYNFN